jgi:multiple sugar transport system permease protein
MPPPTSDGEERFMAGPDYPLVPATTVPAPPVGPSHAGVRQAGRVRRLRGSDRTVVGLMVAVPTALVVWLVWFPAVATVLLSFSTWNGIGGLSKIKWVGTKNYDNVLHNYPPFTPAVEHNVLWLAVLFLVATPFGMFLAVLLDKEMKGSRFYQTAIYLPVVLSLALIGFIWQLFYSQDQGLLNAVFHTKIDWYGDPKINIWAVLVASSWRHVGYIMLLYLAGLKGVDPSLREAASVDGASETKTFFRVVFPVLRPINIIVLVITVIESLRAFDFVWVVNKGRNGLELISALVTQNIIGEASRIGFGSALATLMLVISLVFISIYLATVMRGDER